MKRGISILFRAARKPLRNGSAGQSADGIGNKPFRIRDCAEETSHVKMFTRLYTATRKVLVPSSVEIKCTVQ